MKDLQSFQIVVKPYQVICSEGEDSNDLYYLNSGKLLICTVSGTKVIALARVSPGHFVGELSFFDNKPRATYVIALETSQISLISQDELKDQQVPSWYLAQAKNLTKKIRLLDKVVNQANLRRFESQDHKPLTIEEQRQILAAIAAQKD
jgi:CRP-like cAMP-binding protein